MAKLSGESFLPHKNRLLAIAPDPGQKMSLPAILTSITIICYLSATVCGLCGIIWNLPRLRKAGCILALLSFFCQTLILVFGFHRLMPDGLSFGAYLQLMAWFFLLCGIGAWQRLRQDAILLFAAPLCLLLFLVSAPWLKLPIHVPELLTAPFFALHIGALFLGLGFLGLAFIAGILFLFAEKRIKSKKKMAGFWQDMPALTILDKINSVCTLAAFPLYTIGLAAGFLWAKPVFGAVVSGDAKEVVSFFVWCLLGLLFYNRAARNWRGRKPAWLAVGIFLLSVLSILVVNIFFSAHHGLVRS